MKGIRELRPEAVYPLVYIAAAIYIIIFRIVIDVVPRGAEPEFYPIEIMTTIALILIVVISYLIFYEKRESLRNANASETDHLYLFWFIMFLAFLLAENNWLLGRETTPGTVLFGIIFLVVIILMLGRTFHGNRLVFILIFIALICLMTGTYFDLAYEMDSLESLRFIDRSIFPFERVLLEEIPELYAVLLFLHATLLIYLEMDNGKMQLRFAQKGGFMLVICAIIAGYGNSFLLQDHGRPIPLSRIAIGISLWAFGIFLSFRYVFVTPQSTSSNSRNGASNSTNGASNSNNGVANSNNSASNCNSDATESNSGAPNGRATITRDREFGEDRYHEANIQIHLADDISGPEFRKPDQDKEE